MKKTDNDKKKKLTLKKKHVTPELIMAVLRGEYGDATERKEKLKVEGYSPAAVTNKLNKIAKLAGEIAPVLDKDPAYFACALEYLCMERMPEE